MTFQFKPAIRDRFNKKVKLNKFNGCMEWVGAINKGGYGNFSLKHGDKRLSHRISWEMNRGEIPDKVCVLHKCDNRKCVNPDHLFLGSIADNVADMDKKRRRNTDARHQGESCPLSKLKESQVLKIIELNKKGMKQVDISLIFNIHNSVVSKIVNRKAWKHLWHTHLETR